MRVVTVAGAIALLAATAGCSRIQFESVPLAAIPANEPASTPRPVPPATPRPLPRFAASIRPIDAAVRGRMGTSWNSRCTVSLSRLRVLRLSFWGFDGAVHEGELIVHRRWAKPIVGVFRKLFQARFPIERMEPANGYMGNDPPLAQRNNTVGFHCRASVARPHVWSEHTYGHAVDINPDQNPYVSPSGRIEPPFGRPFVDRSTIRPGVITRNDVVVRAFRAIGWRWGGTYRRSKDYMHFSATGR
jgi:D-alanyl-D-alanine carboxypeptidase-like protein